MTRLRWALVKFGLIAAGATVFATAYALLTTWWLISLSRADPINGRFNVRSSTSTADGTISRNMLPASFNVWTYQPGDRFWLFQYLETGLYVLPAAILILLALRRVRPRRLAITAGTRRASRG